jgi:hypothetical protein
MKLKQTNFEESLKAKHVVCFEDKFWFMEDKPSVHTVDGYISVYLDQHGLTGKYLMPNGMFNMPTTGNLLKVNMRNGDAYFLITSWTQDYVKAEGTVVRLCYVKDWATYLRDAKVIERETIDSHEK